MNPLPAARVLGIAAAVLLAAGAHGSDSAALSVDAAAGKVEISHAGRPILEYVCSPGQFKPYVRKLYAANGLNVLLDAPPDHLHHHGLMYAVRVNGVNFWEEVGDPGHEISVKILSHRAGKTPAGLPQAQFSQLVHWVAHTNAPKDSARPASVSAVAPDTAKVALLIETRTITVTIDKDEVALDWTAEFVVGPAASAVKIHGSAYNGLGLRLPAPFNHVARRQNSAGAPYTAEAKWDVTPGQWAAVTGVADQLEATVALFALPANKGEALFFSMLNPFTYLAVTQNLDQKPIEYGAGEKFRIHYLLTVYPGSRTKEFLDQRADQWAGASPSTVTQRIP